MSQFKQVGSDLTQGGSFINHLMSNNSSEPEVGQFATILHFTDRKVVKVVEVSKDKTKVKIEYLLTEADKSGLKQGESLQHGHQSWKHTPTGQFANLVFRKLPNSENGKWYKQGTYIDYDPNFVKSMQHQQGSEYFTLSPELKAELFGNEVRLSKVVEGKTILKKSLSPIKIIFGVNDYYYDWEF